jgi:hypothetical protein
MSLLAALGLHALLLLGLFYAAAYMDYEYSPEPAVTLGYLAGGALVWVSLAGVLVRWWWCRRPLVWQAPLAWLTLATASLVVFLLVCWPACRRWLWKWCHPWGAREAVAGAAVESRKSAIAHGSALIALPLLILWAPAAVWAVAFNLQHGQVVTAVNCAGLQQDQAPLRRIEFADVSMDLPDVEDAGSDWYAYSCPGEASGPMAVTYPEGTWSYRRVLVGPGDTTSQAPTASTRDEILAEWGFTLEQDVQRALVDPRFRNIKVSSSRTTADGLECLDLKVEYEDHGYAPRQGEVFVNAGFIRECLLPGDPPPASAFIRWFRVIPPEESKPTGDELQRDWERLLEGVTITGAIGAH